MAMKRRNSCSRASACSGMLDQAQVQSKSAITAGFAIGGSMKVVDQDDRVVSDQVGSTLDDLDRLFG